MGDLEDIEFNHADEYAAEVALDDAKDRSWRTFLQNVPLDILLVVAPLLYDAVSGWDGSFSSAYWIAVGVGVAKTAALAVIAYVMRLKKAPKNIEA